MTDSQTSLVDTLKADIRGGMEPAVVYAYAENHYWRLLSLEPTPEVDRAAKELAVFLDEAGKDALP